MPKTVQGRGTRALAPSNCLRLLDEIRYFVCLSVSFSSAQISLFVPGLILHIHCMEVEIHGVIVHSVEFIFSI